VRITYDREKRDATLRERGLDFADASGVFAGPQIERLDEREDYGEERYQTYGYLGGRMVMLAWTPRGKARRIISMRMCNAKERARLRQQFGEDGRDNR
jgi:hypothetical protein